MKPREIVLVIDDLPATLGMLNETLERAGYTVLIAQSGPSAMDLVDRVTPDIGTAGCGDAGNGRL